MRKLFNLTSLLCTVFFLIPLGTLANNKNITHQDNRKLDQKTVSMLIYKPNMSLWMKRLNSAMTDYNTLSISEFSWLKSFSNDRINKLTTRQIFSMIGEIGEGEYLKSDFIIYGMDYRKRKIPKPMFKIKNVNIYGAIYGGYTRKSGNEFYVGRKIGVKTKRLDIDISYEFDFANDKGATELTSLHNIKGIDANVWQNSNSKIKDTNHNIHFLMSYDLLKGRKFSLIYQGSINPYNQLEIETEGNLYNTFTKNKDNNKLHHFLAKYEAHNDMTVSADYTYYEMDRNSVTEYKTNNTNNYTFYDRQVYNRGYVNIDKDLYRKHDFAIRAGANAWMSTSKDRYAYNYAYKPFENRSNYYDYTEHGVSVFGSIDNILVGEVNIGATLSADYHNLNGSKRILPNAKIDLLMLWNRLRTTISTRTIYPSLGVMNNSITNFGSYVERHGNSSVGTAREYKLKSDYSFKRKGTKAVLELVHTKNSIEESIFHSPENAFMIEKPLNWDYKTSASLTFVMPIYQSNLIESKAIIKGNYSILKIDNLNNEPFKTDKLNAELYWNSNFVLSTKPNLSLNINAAYMSPKLYANYTLGSIYRIDTSLEIKLLNNRLKLSVYGNDLLNKATPKISYNAGKQNFSFFAGKYSRSFGIDIAYTFGNYKKLIINSIDTSRLRH